MSRSRALLRAKRHFHFPPFTSRLLQCARYADAVVGVSDPAEWTFGLIAVRGHKVVLTCADGKHSSVFNDAAMQAFKSAFEKTAEAAAVAGTRAAVVGAATSRLGECLRVSTARTLACTVRLTLNSLHPHHRLSRSVRLRFSAERVSAE